MNLDDRLRSAQQAQLSAVEAEVQRRQDTVVELPRTGRQPYAMALASAAAVVILLLQVGPRLASEPTVSAVTPAEGAGPSSQSDSANSAPPTTSSTVVGSTTTDSVAESLATTTVTTGQQTATSTSTSESPVLELDSGIASDVCSSGRRASLEKASLRYISEDTGWNRKEGLVDEQDGPFYFGLWEPGFPGTVSVEVALALPIEATEILLAQHPYQEVSGTITVETADSVVAIELSGQDGFKTHQFGEPERIESFVISRTETASDITEVIICVE